MVNLNPVALGFILLACAVIALVIGYFLGSRYGGKKSVAMREAQEVHDDYKSDVREHFEQTSAIMSRMVSDYRDMYQHMADGAQKLADMHPEKLVTPPPAPEAITEDSTARAKNSAAAEDKPESVERGARRAAPNRDAVMKTDSANDRPWNKENGDPAAQA